MASNFKFYSRETLHVSGKSFSVSFEEAGGVFRAQTRVRWKNPEMGDAPLITNQFKDLQGARKQISTELERLLRGGEIQSGFY
ncbi:MAG TPA: hypothetical protein VJI71_00895 [Candidatus Norongarragalinales archaeon]|nr:hypothetical protein [Candidatus Norongarragalinales archaeon]